MCMMSSLSYRPHIYSHQVWLTDAGRLIPRPHSISLTCTSAVSHQVVACITTVGGCLFKCCSIGMTNSAIGSVIQRTTVYSCWMEVELIHDVHCIANVCYCQSWQCCKCCMVSESSAFNRKRNTWARQCSLSLLWGAQQQHTFTCWFTPRPHSSRLTCTSPVSHKVIPCVTTVGGSLTAMLTRMTTLAIGWGIWSFAWYNCWVKAEVSRTRQDKMMAIQSQCRGQNILLPTSHPYHSQQCQ